MQEFLARTHDKLEQALTVAEVPTRLNDAMRYSTLNGGKRVRALLVYAAGTALDAPLERLDSVAAAIECVHAYSLIHDDLPAMDDDDLRRGKPTTHIQFDEATAILAGDALQTMAFELVACDSSGLDDKQARAITLKLAQASGSCGMVGGQMLDILATNTSLSQAQLENVHRRKTGALINAAVLCGSLCSDDVNAEQLAVLSQYADHLGLAFQVIDDILDIESSTEILGKPSGADIELGKSTYPALLGLAESKELAKNLYDRAIDCVQTISDNSQLVQHHKLDGLTNKFSLLYDLATLIVDRKN